MTAPTNNNLMKFFAIFLGVVLFGVMAFDSAYGVELTTANVKLPPNATKIIKNSDGNYYALYSGNVCALTKIKHHAKSITVPKSIKVKGKRYKVVAIHELGLLERVDVKKVTIKATNLETVEEPALFKDWRKTHHKKLKVKITNKAMRQWLNAKW